MPRHTHQLPDPPASLDDEHAAELSAATEAALRHQRRELGEALRRALEDIPWPLRGAVRRVVGL
jgi:hypothetical protein